MKAGKPNVDHVKPPEPWPQPDNFIGGVDMSLDMLGKESSLFDEFIGAKVDRVYSVPGDIPGYLCIKFCFDNGKSIILSGHNCNFSTVVRVMKGEWEMIKAAPPDLKEEDTVTGAEGHAGDPA